MKKITILSIFFFLFTNAKSQDLITKENVHILNVDKYVYGLYDPTTKSFIYGDTAKINVEIKIIDNTTYVNGLLNTVFYTTKIYPTVVEENGSYYKTLEVDQSSKYCVFTHFINKGKNIVTIQYPEIIYVFNVTN